MPDRERGNYIKNKASDKRRHGSNGTLCMYVVQCISGYCLAPDMSAFIGRHKNERKRVLSARRSAGSMQLGSVIWNTYGKGNLELELE